MRTADRLLAEGLRPPWPVDLNRTSLVHRAAYNKWQDVNPEIVEAVRSCPIIVADNVAAWTSQQDAFVLEEFPSLAPPWPQFWIEYPSASGRERRGVLVRDVTNDDRTVDGSFQGAVNDARENGYDGEIRWVVDLAVIIESATRKIIGPMGWYVLALDPYGRSVGNRWVLGTPRGAEVVDGMRTADGVEVPYNEGWLLAALIPALQTLSFLHVRNIRTERITPPEKLSAKHRRRHGRPLLRYHELRLMLPRRGGSGGTGGDDQFTGLHAVAGHFSHFGACCPPEVHPPKGLLFGKYEGIVWVPDHVRGDPERGVITTDFDVRVSE